MKRWGIGGMMIVLAAAGCGSGGEPTDHMEEPAPPVSEAPTAPVEEPTSPLSMEVWSATLERLDAHTDSVDGALRRVANLTRQEQAALRQDINATQTARARALGVRAGDNVDPLVQSGRLVRMRDTTAVWVVRDLTHSKPFVTPSTNRMLEEMGERFHAALDSAGLPRYRMEITSVLRTPEHQRSLRQINPNAAGGASAHEFGTTVDVAYRRFSAPDLPEHVPGDEAFDQAVAERLEQMHAVKMEDLARLRGTELQAILGRVILDMRREGRLLVRMENQQTVYHMTVNR